MMKSEFEALAGYEVKSDDYYRFIEPMYMACDIDKAEFVKMVSKERFARPTKKQLVKEARKLAKSLHETCELHTDYETQEKLCNVLQDLASRYDYGYGKYLINTRMYYGDFGCSYPKSVTIFDYSFNTIETIELV